MPTRPVNYHIRRYLSHFLHGIKLRRSSCSPFPYLLSVPRAFCTASSENNIHMSPITPTLAPTRRIPFRITTHHRPRLPLAIIQPVTPLPPARYHAWFSAHIHASLHIRPTPAAPDHQRHRMSLHIHQPAHIRRGKYACAELAKRVVHLPVLRQRGRVVVQRRPAAGNFVIDRHHHRATLRGERVRDLGRARVHERGLCVFNGVVPDDQDQRD